MSLGDCCKALQKQGKLHNTPLTINLSADLCSGSERDLLGFLDGLASGCSLPEEGSDGGGLGLGLAEVGLDDVQSAHALAKLISINRCF